MDILLVGYDTPGALERYCEAALARQGCAVQFFDLEAEYRSGQRLAALPVVGRIEQRGLLKRANQRLIEEIAANRPNVVFAFKGMELLPDTLAAIRRLPDRPLLINWNPDNPFDTSVSNSSRDLIDGIRAYDVYFIWDRDLFIPLREAGARQVEYLPFAYDRASHFPVELTLSERAELRTDVCFVGGYTARRAEKLARLAHHRIGIWGPNWQHLPSNHPLSASLRGGWTYGEAMSRLFSAAGVVMNFIRPQNGQAHNMRTFEAPATGALMVSTRTRDQRGWLPEKEAAAYFETSEEMVEQIDYYLAHVAERQQLAQAGYRCITGGQHTYDDRMRQILQVVNAC